MPITFTCPHCQAKMTVPDAVAGKRGKCSKCKGAVSVPASTNGASSAAPAVPPSAAKNQGETARGAAPPAPPEDLDELALSVLGDEPKAEEKPTDFVEFKCPQCDEPLKLARDLAGKKHPCPECRRIISVPIPKKKDPANWRDTGPNLPPGARRDTEPAPLDVWGTGQKTGPSDESLREAGVIQEKHKPATLFQRMKPFLILGSPLIVLVGGGIWLWVWMTQLTEKRAYDHATAFAASDKAASLVGNEGLAALYAYSGEYQQKSGRSGSADRARDEYSNAIARAQAAGNSKPERDALLLDLLPTILSLAGSREEVEAGGKKPIADVQRLIEAALRAVAEPEARLEGVRRLAMLLIERKDAGRILPVTMKVYAAIDADRAEALGVVGLELLRSGNKELAADAAKQALEPIADPKGKKKQPALRASVVALAIATDQTPPKPGKTLDLDAERADRVGRASGLAHKGQADEARKVAGEAVNADARFRALVAIAEATGEASDINAAQDAVVPNPELRWPALRLVALAQQAKLASERQEAAANAVPGGLSGWANLWLLRVRLAGSRSAEGLEVLEKKFPAQSLAEKVARLELTRHNTRHSSGWQKNVKDWDEGPKAFGMLGAALGMQGK